MKDFLFALTSMLGAAALILLLMPWIIEYTELYFTWVRSHFNHI